MTTKLKRACWEIEVFFKFVLNNLNLRAVFPVSSSSAINLNENLHDDVFFKSLKPPEISVECSGSSLQCLDGEGVVLALAASALLSVTDGVVMRTAA